MADSNPAVRPIITLIGALGENRVIGRDNKLLWRLPADMKVFRERTTGYPGVMGRRTFEAIGRPLPKRRNIVLTKNREARFPGCETAGSAEEAVAMCAGDRQIFVIGGAEIYREFLPRADSMLLTELHHTFDGDSFFPEWNGNAWEVVWEREGETDALNPYAYTFREYRKLNHNLK